MKSFLNIFGENYLYYHLASLILHGLNCFLIWKILSKLKYYAAFWIAVLYCVHPMQLLTLGWIIQFKTILSIFFFLISLLFFILFYLKEKYRFLILALFLFGLSLLSKSSTAGLVAVLLVFIPKIRKKFGFKKISFILLPFLLIATYAVVRTTWSYHFKEIFPGIVSHFDQTPLATSTTVIKYHQAPVAERFALALKVFSRYLVYLVYPSSNPIFQKKIELNFRSPEFFGLFAALLFILYLGKDLLRQGSELLQASYFFFLISLIPFCGIVWIPIFQYSNLIPYWLSVPALGLLPLLSHYIPNKKIIAALVVVFAIVSHIQSYDFKSTDKIFLKSIAHSPEEKSYYVALIEQYLYGLDCQGAEKTLEQLKKLSGNEEAALTTKTTRCFQVQNGYKTSK